MFDEETVNAFSGGYKISKSGVVTLFGRPAVSTLKRVIAFPASLSMARSGSILRIWARRL